MPELLVSLCNLPKPRESALLRIDTETGAIASVPLGAGMPIKSCTGLAIDQQRLYVLCADAEVRSYIAVLNRTSLEPLAFQFLPEVIDGHSLLLQQGRLLVVSTGNDAIIGYDITEHGLANPALAWNIPDDSGTHHDTHHLNGIAAWRGEIVFSAFGPKAGQTWSSATDGYIFSLSRNAILKSGIYQPHSLKEWQGELHYCESARGTLASSQACLLEIGAYTRGLEFLPDDIVAIGSSVGRKVSKSTGLINNPGDPGARAGNCEVALYRLGGPGTPQRLKTIGLDDYGPEIYDLLCLAPAAPGTRQGVPAGAGAMHAAAGPDPDRAILDRHQMLTELIRTTEAQQAVLGKLNEELRTARESLAIARQELAAHDSRLTAARNAVEGARTELERLRAEIAQAESVAARRAQAAATARPDILARLARLFGK